MLRQQNIEEFLESVARAQRSVLLLDYDGTLAPFSVDRQLAVPYPGLRDLLQQIIDVGRTRLVIITGRDAHEIDPFLRLRPAPFGQLAGQPAGGVPLLVVHGHGMGLKDQLDGHQPTL